MISSDFLRLVASQIMVWFLKLVALEVLHPISTVVCCLAIFCVFGLSKDTHLELIYIYLSPQQSEHFKHPGSLAG